MAALDNAMVGRPRRKPGYTERMRRTPWETMELAVNWRVVFDVAAYDVTSSRVERTCINQTVPKVAQGAAE